MATRKELTEVLRGQYHQATRAQKGEILDAFIRVTGYHRKHAIRVLNAKEPAVTLPRTGRRIYDEAVREALLLLWETADRICGKRLKAILPSLIESMERHGHLHLDPQVHQRLMTISPATIDRLLAPARAVGKKGRKRRSRSTAVGRQVPIRTAAGWDNPQPGYFEADFVAHCGGSMAGSFIHSLVLTDIASGWTDCLPLLAREQTLVVEAFEQFRTHLPIPILGIDTDNDGAFINQTLFDYCIERKIEQTRGRPRRSNDQAWIEQKNGAVVRRLIGYHRYSGVEAGQVLAHLFRVARLYVNYFQPSFKLKEKIRRGARVTKRYYPPATPCERLLAHPEVTAETKEKLRGIRVDLDPVQLLQAIRETQQALIELTTNSTSLSTKRSESLEQFLARLPELWRVEEVRPTHRRPSQGPRTWRTRSDPYAAVWPQVLEWLEAAPDMTAKALFKRLCEQHPETFQPGQLRTLQRRVQAWRRAKARELIQLCSSPVATTNLEPSCEAAK
jgi:hypothetical protein